jgi:hypothetical protein
VSLINGGPLAAHNHEHGWYISFITLCRGCALYPRAVIPSLAQACKALIHSRGERPGIHYEAFTKILWGYSRPLGFLNVPHSSPKGNPHSAERTAYTEPHWRHDGEANYTSVLLINMLRASHTTLMVSLFFWVVIKRTGPYREALEKPLESPKIPQVYHHIQNQIIVSSLYLIMFIDYSKVVA